MARFLSTGTILILTGFLAGCSGTPAKESEEPCPNPWLRILRGQDGKMSLGVFWIFNDSTVYRAEALPVLIEAINDGDPFVRENAVQLLGQMGADARDAVPKLLEALHDKNRTDHPQVEWALEVIGRPPRDASDPLSDEVLVTRWRQKRVDSVGATSEYHYEKCEPWIKFMGKMEQGDELWHFRSPGPTWEVKAGWEGFAIFRGDNLVATFTLKKQ